VIALLRVICTRSLDVSNRFKVCPPLFLQLKLALTSSTGMLVSIQPAVSSGNESNGRPATLLALLALSMSIRAGEDSVWRDCVASCSVGGPHRVYELPVWVGNKRQSLKPEERLVLVC